MTINKIIYDEFIKLVIKRHWTVEDETKHQEIMKFLVGTKDAQSEDDLIKRIT